MRVSLDVMAVLDRATCEGNALSLVACGTLDRKLYLATDAVLKAAGGTWNRKAKAHLFEGDAAEAIEPILLTGEVVSVRTELQQFLTPPDLAQRVIAAHAFGCSESTIYWTCLKLGAEGPRLAPLRPYGSGPSAYTRNGSPVRRFTPADDARMLALEASGMTFSAIARVMGRRHNSVTARLRTLARLEARREAA